MTASSWNGPIGGAIVPLEQTSDAEFAEELDAEDGASWGRACRRRKLEDRKTSLHSAQLCANTRAIDDSSS